MSLSPALADAVISIASLGITAALAVIVPMLKQRWGIEIEAKHRDALHSALMTGIAAALGRGLTGQGAVAAALAHVRAGGAPDAVRYFGLAEPALERMAMAKLQEMLPAMPASAIRPPLQAGLR